MGIRPRDTGWFLTLAVGGLGLLVALMAVATRLATPSELAVIPTEAWPWTSNGVQVDPVSPVSDFRAGDLVVAMDGRSMEQWVESAIPFATGGAVPEAGPTVTFDVLRDGQIELIAFRTHQQRLFAGRVATEVIDGRVMRDFVDPGRELEFCAVATEGAVDLYEDFLREIEGRFIVADHAVDIG